MATKLNEVKQFSLEFIVSKLGYSRFSAEEIKKTELSISRQMNWELDWIGISEMAILMINTADHGLKDKEKEMLQCILEIVAVSVSYNQKILSGLSLEMVAACVAYLSLKKL